MIIEVTKSDIRYGTRKDANKCPVANALNRATGSTEMRAYDDRIVRGYSGNNYSERYHSPRSVARFIHRFDDGKKVRPFRFILREV